MYSPDTFRDCVLAQVDLLTSGQPLDAFDQFYADDVTVYVNNVLIATGTKEARAKQAKSMQSASDIQGQITDLTIAEDTEMCVFRNRTSFAKGKGRTQIDGLCWQKWRNNKVIQEQYFDGTLMERLIAGGLLKQPDNLARRR